MNLAKRFLILTVVLLGGLTFFSGQVSAVNITSRGDVPVDDNLADLSVNNYSPASKILLVRISPPQGMQYSDSSEWYKGFYYYTITKLGFRDVPFSYVVTWQGDVFQGRGGGVDVKPLIAAESQGNFGNSVLIAYFDNGREVTNSGEQALIEVVSKVMGENGIGKAAISANDVFIQSEGEEVTESGLIISSTASGEWGDMVNEVKAGSSAEGSSARAHKGSVEEVEYVEEVEGGNNFVVTARIKNEGDFPWYSSGEKITYVATSDERGHESAFFVNDKWASFSRVVTFEEDWIAPGETAEFSFEMAVPLIPGEYSEKFELVETHDNWIADTQFTVSFTVSAGDYNLVEVQDTETGSLNVRSCTSVNCDQVAEVVPGDVLINLGKDGAWYKIRTSDGTEGWVYGKYIREL